MNVVPPNEPNFGEASESVRWDPLEDWQRRPHLPVWIIDEDPGAQIMLAMLKRVAVQFRYFGREHSR